MGRKARVVAQFPDPRQLIDPALHWMIAEPWKMEWVVPYRLLSDEDIQKIADKLRKDLKGDDQS